MKKRIVSLLLAVSLLIIPAHAVENSMANFTRDTENRPYTGQFSDLTADSPFYDNVSALYEYGLTVGKGDGTFGLTDSLTVSQLVIFAGRIRSLYRTGDAESGPAAHKTAEPQAVCLPYLLYLKDEGVVGDELDDLLFTTATRAQAAHVLANVLPPEDLPLINDAVVTEAYATRQFITDVDEYTPYQQDILRLYRAGIAIGSDATGSFLPNAPISRGALAALLTRVADPALRIPLNLQYPVPDVSAVTLSSIVEPGQYYATPATRAELDSAVRYMLYLGQDALRLRYPDLTDGEGRQLLTALLETVKVYCEQGYNTARATVTEKDVAVIFSASGATQAEVARYRAETLAAAKAVHDALWGQGFLHSGMTEQEKALIYFIWVAENCVYDDGTQENALSHLPYGLFRNGVAVCDGYTGAYNLLLKLEGIDCRAWLQGDHIWTVATLDGTEYHIDATWGDAGERANLVYFAMTEAESLLVHRDV